MRLTTRTALAGAADTALFLAQRRRMFTEAPQRAYGSVAFGGLWLALAAKSAFEDRPDNATVALAAVLAAANGAMLGIHLRNRIMSPRVFGCAALSAVALVDVVRRR